MEKTLSCLKQQIDELLNTDRQILVAIDGNCTAGKTTLTALLEKEYDCNIFHMDDFFLRSEQRTPERYAQPGGNVDYERFREEVLIPLRRGEEFSYRPFSCATFTLKDPVQVRPKKLNIIEGTYSQHPYFGDAYDLRVLMTITPELQRKRILKRPEHLHERFFEAWIPMERLYFDHFSIAVKSDIRLDMTDSKL